MGHLLGCNGLSVYRTPVKIATFNVNSLRKRLPIVLDWLAHQKPDVLCLQETKVQDSEFPLLALAESGYDITYRGMKSYNGVAILSREKPEAVSYGFDDGGEPEDARLLRVVIKGIPIINTTYPRGSRLTHPSINTSLAGMIDSASISKSICRRTNRSSGAVT